MTGNGWNALGFKMFSVGPSFFHQEVKNTSEMVCTKMTSLNQE
jgi:hypothetical protein